MVFGLQEVPQDAIIFEKSTKDDTCVTDGKVITKVSPSSPKTSTSKAFKAVKQDSEDSLPEQHGIDPFDRAKTPDPQEPGTLVFAFKNGESSSESYNPIEKYYASKNEIHSNQDTQEDQWKGFKSIAKCRDRTKQEMDEKRSNEEKRNSVLFPNMSQNHIDTLILEVCEKR